MPLRRRELTKTRRRQMRGGKYRSLNSIIYGIIILVRIFNKHWIIVHNSYYNSYYIIINFISISYKYSLPCSLYAQQSNGEQQNEQ